jgi:LysM repeat protein
VQALSLLLGEFSPEGDDVSAAFKEQIKVEPRAIPVDKYFASPAEALEAILAGARSGETHVVTRGETAWGISQRLGVPLSRLAQSNPTMDLDHLRVGEELTLPAMHTPITVVARREIREDVGEGLRRRTRAVRITYENGGETKREVIGQRRTPVRAFAGPPTRQRDPYRWRDEIPR